MSFTRLQAALCAAAFSHIISAQNVQAQAAPPDPGGIPLDVVVTAFRQPQSIQRSGSAISVIRADEIAKSAPGSITDLLRGQKAVEIVHNGSTYRLQATRLGKLILTK